MGKSIETERMIAAAHRHKRLVAHPLTPEMIFHPTEQDRKRYGPHVRLPLSAYERKYLQPDEVTQILPEMLPHLDAREMRMVKAEQLTSEVISLLNFEQVKHLSREVLTPALAGQLREDQLPYAYVMAELKAVLNSREAVNHADQYLDKVFTGDVLSYGKENNPLQNIGPALLRSNNPLVQQAAVYRITEMLYNNNFVTKDGQIKPEAQAILESIGFTNVKLLNMGPGSDGRLPEGGLAANPDWVPSNQQALVLVDDTDPLTPIVLVTFRGTGEDPKALYSDILAQMPKGTKVRPDYMTHVLGGWDEFVANRVGTYEREFDNFMRAAGDDIFTTIESTNTRAMNNAEGLNAWTQDDTFKANTQVWLAGHSYGGDPAARLVSVVAERHPELAEAMRYIGFAPTPTLMVREQLRPLIDLLGPDSPYAGLDMETLVHNKDDVRAPIERQIIAMYRETLGPGNAYAKLNIDRLDAGKRTEILNVLVKDLCQQLGNRVTYHGGTEDPLIWATGLIQALSMDDPGQLGNRITRQGNHEQYAAVLFAESVSQQVLTTLEGMDASSAYEQARWRYTMARSGNLPVVMDMAAYTIMTSQQANLAQMIQVFANHTKQREEALARGVAPAEAATAVTILPVTDAQIVGKPQEVEQPIPAQGPMVEEQVSKVTQLLPEQAVAAANAIAALPMQEAGPIGVADALQAPVAVIATPSSEKTLIV